MESIHENALCETRARGVRKITCTGSCAGLHANFYFVEDPRTLGVERWRRSE